MDDQPGGVLNALLPGDPAKVGPYDLVGRIGEGGMGAVFLGRAPDGRRVAVKVIRPELARDGRFAARFQDEVAHAQRVASFCTAQVLDHGTDDGRAYMVTEFINGTSLLEYVREHGALSSGMLQGVAVGVAAALVAIHSAGLVHRDLKPSNVLLSLSGPRVIDFGIARALDASPSHTRTGQLIGSPGWMAPEQIQVAQVTTAADIFAWGCLVAYAGSGAHPYGSGDFSVMAYRITHGEVDPGIVSALPRPLDRLVARALQITPELRPTARDLLLAMVGGGGGDSEAAVLSTLNRSWNAPPAAQAYDLAQPPPADLPLAQPPPPGPSGEIWPSTRPETAPVRPGKARRRTPLVAALVAAVLIVGAGGGLAGWLLRDPGRTSPPSGAETSRAGTPGGGSSTAADPNALPTGAMLVRVDHAGWNGKTCATNIGKLIPGTDQPQTILPGPYCDYLPKWSPDGHKKIAFIRTTGNKLNGPSALYTMTADGQNVFKVTDRIIPATAATWYKDGTLLAYMAKDSNGHPQIHIINADGTNDQEVTTDDNEKDDPRFSHDGKKIVIWEKIGDTTQLVVVTIGDPRDPAALRHPKVEQVTHSSQSTDDPTWSPDDTKIAYIVYVGSGSNEIHIVDLATGTDQRLTHSGLPDMDPAWSSSGTWLCFVRGPVSTPVVYAIRADGTGERPIGPPGAGHPDW